MEYNTIRMLQRIPPNYGEIYNGKIKYILYTLYIYVYMFIL